MATTTQTSNWNWGWWIIAAIVVIGVLSWIAWGSYGHGTYYDNNAAVTGGTGTTTTAPATNNPNTGATGTATPGTGTATGAGTQ